MACLGSVLVDPLLARLHDPDPLIRKQILEVLTNIYCRDENGMDASDPRLINTLVSGMADADACVREKAFYNACTLISNCEISQEAFARLEQAVVEAISSPDTHIRKAATRAAYVFRAPAVRNALVTLLQSPDAQTRQWAIQHLGYSHEPPAVTDALVDALHDPEIHIEVTLALARLGDSRAIEPLCRLLQDEAYCYEAVVMLHRLKVPQAIPALLSLITSRSVPAQDREHAAIVLGEMGLPALNPLLHAGAD